MRIAALLALSVAGAAAAPQRATIRVDEYRDKVYASWLGQCIGNIYGLAHEQKYFFEPGPDPLPAGYTGWGAERMKRLNGAFSDDDTDIEYMYLLAMEQHGVEPSYSQLAEYWRRHVRKDVWLANRAAVAALRYGYDPPWSGRRGHNPHWFQIDPQLVNEIWAVTAPGMLRYAAQKTGWAARIMSDDWGTEPAIAYAAMYAAAFFETDIAKLIESGRQSLPPGSRFERTIAGMVDLHRRYPNDWKAARREVVAKYAQNEPESTRTGTNADINGAFGILALLYGGGDIRRTLEVACSLGFDADNQAATMAGLLGVVHGTKGLPKDLLFPFPDRGWTEPFNDRYYNVTREDLPDASLKDVAARMAVLGEKTIERSGGRRVVDRNGVAYYEIFREASFAPPFEFPAGPAPVIENGAPVDHQFAVVCPSKPSWSLGPVALPKGLRFVNGRLTGSTRERPGVYPITVRVRCASRQLSRDLKLLVRGPNAAPSAQRIITPVEQPDLSVVEKIQLDMPKTLFAPSPEAMRDGRRSGDGATFASLGAGSSPRTDAYGYEWSQPRKIGALALTTGFVGETSGWFESIGVQYQDETGHWRDASGVSIQPPFPAGRPPSFQAHFVEFMISFEPVVTRAIRVAGPVGSAVKDAPRFSSMAELSVYGEIPVRE